MIPTLLPRRGTMDDDYLSFILILILQSPRDSKGTYSDGRQRKRPCTISTPWVRQVSAGPSCALPPPPLHAKYPTTLVHKSEAPVGLIPSRTASNTRSTPPGQRGVQSMLWPGVRGTSCPSYCEKHASNHDSPTSFETTVKSLVTIPPLAGRRHIPTP